MKHCCGQAYNGAANMGCTVQALLNESPHIHCLAHGLNLCIKEVTCACDKIVLFSTWLNRVFPRRSRYFRSEPEHCCQNRCQLCNERLRDAHTHPLHWNCELQQFLLPYSAIPLSSCVCKPDERSIRRDFCGKFKGEFIPRWVKHGIKKQKPPCCVHGCSVMSERSRGFASYDVISAAVSVSVDKATDSGPSTYPLCAQHYYIVFDFCRNDIECALCGCKGSHHGTGHFRPLPESDSVTVLMQTAGSFDKSLNSDSVVGKSCYLFCKTLLEHCDEDLRSPESILGAVEAKVHKLQSRLSQCSNSAELPLLPYNQDLNW